MIAHLKPSFTVGTARWGGAVIALAIGVFVLASVVTLAYCAGWLFSLVASPGCSRPQFPDAILDGIFVLAGVFLFGILSYGIGSSVLAVLRRRKKTCWSAVWPDHKHVRPCGDGGSNDCCACGCDAYGAVCVAAAGMTEPMPGNSVR